MKRFAVTVVGAGLILAGLALMVLPGPGILLVVAGLGVLATEYVWAKRFLGRAKDHAERAQRKAVASPIRIGVTVVFAVAMCVLGVLMLIVDDIGWPVLDSLLDSVWSPVAGGVLVVTSLILLTTTTLAVRASRGEDTTSVRSQS